MADANARHFWITQARLVAIKQNLASWLTLFLPAFLGVMVVGSCAILLLRRQAQPIDWVGWTAATILVFGAAAIVFRQRRAAWSVQDGMVRLEMAMGLHNALSAAHAGISVWPSPRDKTSDALSWRWSRLLWPIAGGVALWLAASQIPLPEAFRKVPRPREVPPAWTEVETMLDTLKKEDLVEPLSLQNVQEQLDALRGQDAQEWYEHSSLEAGDNLRAETDQAIRDLQKNLQVAAENAARIMERGDTPFSDSDLKAMDQALGGALQNLENGKLGLNKELLKKLQKLDSKSIKSLSPEQLAQLQQQLKKGNGACQACVGGTESTGGKKGESVFEGLEKPGQSGGPGGGGGPAPLTQKNASVNLHSKETDTLSSDDLSRALPGEVLGLSGGEHQVDKTQTATTTAGAISSNGEGGQAVWKDNLTPAERTTLEHYFK